MPDKNTHQIISNQRTHNKFQELHKWIDEPREWLKHNHRIERHSYNSDYEDYIEKKWGKGAVVEWLFHVALDNLETAQKKAFGVYSKTYGEMVFVFDGGKINSIKFTKLTGKYKRSKTYSKNGGNNPNTTTVEYREKKK